MLYCSRAMAYKYIIDRAAGVWQTDFSLRDVTKMLCVDDC